MMYYLFFKYFKSKLELVSHINRSLDAKSEIELSIFISSFLLFFIFADISFMSLVYPLQNSFTNLKRISSNSMSDKSKSLNLLFSFKSFHTAVSLKNVKSPAILI